MAGELVCFTAQTIGRGPPGVSLITDYNYEKFNYMVANFWKKSNARLTDKHEFVGVSAVSGPLLYEQLHK